MRTGVRTASGGLGRARDEGEGVGGRIRVDGFGRAGWDAYPLQNRLEDVILVERVVQLVRFLRVRARRPRRTQGQGESLGLRRAKRSKEAELQRRFRKLSLSLSLPPSLSLSLPSIPSFRLFYVHSVVADPLCVLAVLAQSRADPRSETLILRSAARRIQRAPSRPLRLARRPSNIASQRRHLHNTEDIGMRAA